MMPPGTPIFQLSTPDLMGITPQMLAAYFSPAGTNAAVALPFRVGFVPPVAPPGLSSHSEYNVK